MKKFSKYILFLLPLIFIMGCGEGSISIDDAEYQPKITIDAYLFGGQPIKDIHITRNNKLNQPIDFMSIVLVNAKVKITEKSSNKVFNLTYNPTTMSFASSDSSYLVEYGKTYKLEVEANVDGRNLKASSETTVPLKGLRVLHKVLGSFSYRELDSMGEVVKLNVDFVPSEQASATILSISALKATTQNFIYDNAFFSKIDSSKVSDRLDDFKQSYTWQQAIAPGTPLFTIPIDWFSIWFYSNYRVIIYAADRNFHHFLVTSRSVMEQDGNFHEPKMYIEGDGIGVFGSAVVDTVFFEIHQ